MGWLSVPIEKPNKDETEGKAAGRQPVQVRDLFYPLDAFLILSRSACRSRYDLRHDTSEGR